ncbi:YybH family protein [Bradyrhizobium mercantei]|uniref:YybH family protein n=1 Tax=Bradyrhizobium mercantei TaxID=1904807 RepID=UPI0009FB7A86|nr:nuclear transport factor 2 family protein [Bradyrhizobium mercantei]
MPANTPQACMADFTATLIERDIDSALTFLTDDVVLFYSNGTAISGKEVFSATMQANWRLVEDYEYSTLDSIWITQSDSSAAVIYSFAWTAKVRGENVGGGGRGTRVFRKEHSGWLLAHEHLSTGQWRP